MKVFVLDLWHDLREKRLWPVAVGLVIALLAVPILLAKPAPEESGPAPAPAATAGGDKEARKAIVQLVEDATEESSSLRLFDPRDPFAGKGVKDLETLSSTDIVSAAEALTAASEEESGGGGSSGGGASEGGSEPSSGGGSTGGDTPPATVPDSGGGGGTQVAKYSYVIDVTFWSNGKARTKTGMSKLEMLPNESSPLLIFLGVDSDGSDAVFLVDSSLKAEGEGACSPRPSDCGVLALGSGSQHNFTDDNGNSYTLRIDEIRRKRLSSASAARARSKPAARTAVGPSGSRDEATQARRFMPPILADLVTVASSEGDGSSSDKDRR
jgi:hypothetical protein